MQSPTGEPVDIYLKAKSVLSSSQSAVDALSQFMAARADLERTYANALTKLAKTSLNVDETSLHPAVFEAIASLRGDVANEARQHSEMFTSINKDVLEPLASLKETADMVVRVSSEAKRSTKDVRICYERCKKAYNKYLGLYKRACDACAVAGLPQPPLWIPDPDKPYPLPNASSSSSSASVSSAASRGGASNLSSQPGSAPGTPSRGNAGSSAPLPRPGAPSLVPMRAHSDGPGQRVSSSSSSSSSLSSSSSPSPSASASASAAAEATSSLSRRQQGGGGGGPPHPPPIHTRDLTRENAELTPEPSTKVQLSQYTSSNSTRGGAAAATVATSPEESLSVPPSSSSSSFSGSYRTASGRLKRVPGLPSSTIPVAAPLSLAQPHARSLGEEGRRLSEESRKERERRKQEREGTMATEGEGEQAPHQSKQKKRRRNTWDGPGAPDATGIKEEGGEGEGGSFSGSEDGDDDDEHDHEHERHQHRHYEAEEAVEKIQNDDDLERHNINSNGSGTGYGSGSGSRRASAPAGAIHALRDEILLAEAANANANANATPQKVARGDGGDDGHDDNSHAVGGGKSERKGLTNSSDRHLTGSKRRLTAEENRHRSSSSSSSSSSLLSPVVAIAASKSPVNPQPHLHRQPARLSSSSSEFHAGLIGGKDDEEDYEQGDERRGNENHHPHRRDGHHHHQNNAGRRHSAGSIGGLLGDDNDDIDEGGVRHHHHRQTGTGTGTGTQSSHQQRNHRYSDSETETLDDDSSSTGLSSSLSQHHSRKGIISASLGLPPTAPSNAGSALPAAAAAVRRRTSSGVASFPDETVAVSSSDAGHRQTRSTGSSGAASANRSRVGSTDHHQQVGGEAASGAGASSSSSSSTASALASWGFNFGGGASNKAKAQQQQQHHAIEEADSVGRSISFGAFASGNLAGINRQLSNVSSGGGGGLGSGKDEDNSFTNLNARDLANDDSFSIASSEYSNGTGFGSNLGAGGGWGMKLKSVTSYFLGNNSAKNKDGGVADVIAHSSSFSFGAGGSSSIAAYGGSGNANMTTEERLQSMRSHAHGCMQEAETARQECVEAWTAHARARSKFHDQATGAMAIFIEIDRKRSLEMCDSMRRYTVVASSMLANLQYDTQRLAATIEQAGTAAERNGAHGSGSASTTTSPALSGKKESSSADANDPFSGVSPIISLQNDIAAYLDYTTPSLTVSIAPEAGGVLKPASGGGLWWSAAQAGSQGGGGDAGGHSPIHRSMSGRSLSSTGSAGGGGGGGGGGASLGPAIHHSLSGVSTSSATSDVGLLARAPSMSLPAGALAAGAPGAGGSMSSRRASVGSTDSSGSGSGGGGGSSSLLKKATLQAAASTSALLPPPMLFDPNTGGHTREPTPSSSSSSALAGVGIAGASVSASSPLPSASLPSSRPGIPPLAPSSAGGGSAKAGKAERHQASAMNDGTLSPGGSAVVPSLSLSAFTAGFVPSPPPSSASAPASLQHSSQQQHQQQQQLHDRTTSSFQLAGKSSARSSVSGASSTGSSGQSPSFALPDDHEHVEGHGHGHEDDEEHEDGAHHDGAAKGSPGGPAGAGGQAGAQGGKNSVSRFFRFGGSGSSPSGASPLQAAGSPGAAYSSRPHISSPLAPRASKVGAQAQAQSATAMTTAASGSGGSEEGADDAIGVTGGGAATLDLSSLSSAGGGSGTGSKSNPGKTSFWSRFMSPTSTSASPSSSASPAAGGAGASATTPASPAEGNARSGKSRMLSITAGGSKKSSPPPAASSSSDGSSGGNDPLSSVPSIAAAFAADPGPIELCVAALFDPSQERLNLGAILSASSSSSTAEGGSSTNGFVVSDSLRAVLRAGSGGPHTAEDNEHEDEIPVVEEFDDGAADDQEERGKDGVYHPRPSAVAGITKDGKFNGGASSTRNASSPSSSTASSAAASGSTAGKAYQPPERPLLRDFSVWAKEQSSKELNPVAAILLSHCCGLLSSSAEGLPRLVAALEARRGEGAVLTRASCLALVRVFIRALDVAAVISDFSSARALMIMSQTFYTFLQPTEEVEELLLHPLVAASNTLKHGRSADTLSTGGAGALATPAKASSVETNAEEGIYSTPPSVAGGSGSSSVSRTSTGSAVLTRRRVYVQAFVRGHHIWSSSHYWENAIFETLGTEMTKMWQSHHQGQGQHIHEGGGVGSMPVSSPSTPVAAAAGVGVAGSTAAGASKSTKDREKEKEAEAALIDGEREHAITAGQLAFFAFNMMSFRVPDHPSPGSGSASSGAGGSPNITGILDKYARFIRLDAAETARLMASVAAFRQEHTRQVQTEEKEKQARLAARGASTAAAPAVTMTITTSSAGGSSAASANTRVGV